MHSRDRKSDWRSVKSQTTLALKILLFLEAAIAKRIYFIQLPLVSEQSRGKNEGEEEEDSLSFSDSRA